MSRGPITFRQGDLTRALRAAKAAGIPITRVEIEKDGKIALIATDASATVLPLTREDPNEWDKV